MQSLEKLDARQAKIVELRFFGGLSIEETAYILKISETTVKNWVSRAEIDDGVKPGVTSNEAAELREARKRIRLLEQENEVLRRAAAYLSQGSLPK